MERLYDYICSSCDVIQEAWRHIAVRDETPPCVVCGGGTMRVLMKAHRPVLDLSFPGEDLRNNRSAIKEYERSNKLINRSKKEGDND